MIPIHIKRNGSVADIQKLLQQMNFEFSGSWLVHELGDILYLQFTDIRDAWIVGSNAHFRDGELSIHFATSSEAEQVYFLRTTLYK
jgi:hypothetical protein